MQEVRTLFFDNLKSVAVRPASYLSVLPIRLKFSKEPWTPGADLSAMDALTDETEHAVNVAVDYVASEVCKHTAGRVDSDARAMSEVALAPLDRRWNRAAVIELSLSVVRNASIFEAKLVLDRQHLEEEFGVLGMSQSLRDAPARYAKFVVSFEIFNLCFWACFLYFVK